MKNQHIPPNPTDISDIATIIAEYDNKIKEMFLNFPYQNSQKTNYSCFSTKKFPLPRIKDRKLVSNRIDPELPDNTIQTSKYSRFGFWPMNLFEQFSRKANLYFLFIGIMQALPEISISSNIPVIFLPLLVIIAATAGKDYYEDNKRKKSDREENIQKVYVYENEEFIEKAWKQIRVGNIIKVYQDECIPADLILLSANGNHGVCYIETKNLDGETNLKIKTVHPDLRAVFEAENFEKEKVVFEYERPNPYLSSFSGTCSCEENKVFSLDLSNFILRGSRLKNTKYICGFVAYTGHETKIMLNSFKAKVKNSRVEIMMGRQIMMVFIVQIIVCFFASSIYLIWFQNHKEKLGYLNIEPGSLEDSCDYNFFVRFGNWILIFTNFVPISLLVTLEAVKVGQGFCMSKDPQMRTEKLETKLVVQSSNLNEELGQIKFVFSDKTGTLTCNKMDFKYILINGIVYGKLPEDHEKYIKSYSNFPKVTNVDFHDMTLLDILDNPEHNQHEIVKHTLFFLAICHTIVAETKQNEIVYNASSPDELAFVNFAKFCGVEFQGLQNNYMLIHFKGNIYKFKLLHTFEFTSSRKRQSVIFETEDKQIFLYTKGADSILENLLSSTNNNDLLDHAWNELKNFGCQGLRTLVLAEKKLEYDEYIEWLAEYESAKKSLEKRRENIELAQEKMEKKLRLIGATAIQDKLQEGVRETIEALRDAGIKVWVLTGDKIETAVNIGYSCGLLDSTMQRFIIEDKREGHLMDSFDKCLSKIEKLNYDRNALIIDGDSLIHTLIKPFLCKKMLKICEQCYSVLCCRVSPKQKQEIVTLMRSQLPDHSTLAIGDGANDVNMITAAHVGIGIKGLEGQQAARASDYAISQFRFLRRLLFYHGRECYRKNSTLVCYNFFKNILLVLPQFWFGFFNYFSGQSLYDSFIYQMFNILYTSCPIMIYAVIDKELEPEILVANKLNYYDQGMKNSLFNRKVFWQWFFFGVLQSTILTLFSVYILGLNFINEEGMTQELWNLGTMIFGQTVFLANFKILCFSNTYNVMSISIILFTLTTFIISLLIANIVKSSELYNGFNSLILTPYFHLGNTLIIFSTAFLDFGFESYIRFRRRQELLLKREEYIEFMHLKKLRHSRIIESNYSKQPIAGKETNHKDIIKENDLFSQYSFIRRKDKKLSTISNIDKNPSVIKSRLENGSFALSPSTHPIKIPFEGEIIKQIYLPNTGFAFTQDSPVENRNLQESRLTDGSFFFENRNNF